MIRSHGQTDVGRRRTINEDAIHAADGLYVVCDGMGGHKAGEVASRLAVETIVRFVERSAEDDELTWPFGFDPRLSYDANCLGTAVRLANRAVFRQASSADEYTGMGTTVAAVLAARRAPGMTYAHVGDSRIYLGRGGDLVPLTRDDSWASLLAASASGGPAPDPGPMRNILTKALGARETVEFEVRDQPLADGDRVLLCSDGLTGMLADGRIEELVRAHGEDLEGACRALIEAANAAGGRDNVSVILVEFRR